MGSTTNANRVVIPAGSAAAAGAAGAGAAGAAPAEPKPTPMLRGSKPSSTKTIHGRSEDSAGETRRRKASLQDVPAPLRTLCYLVYPTYSSTILLILILITTFSVVVGEFARNSRRSSNSSSIA